MTTTLPVEGQPDEATRLSTRPEERPAPRRGDPFGPLRMGWRQLTSMRNALLLLFLLALAAVPGGFLPQRRLNPIRVNDYIKSHPTVGPLLDKLQMYDVFGSVWFSAIYLLLFVSLIGCLIPRTKLHLRALLRKPPKVPHTLKRLPVSDTWQTGATPDQVAAAARSALRGGRWRSVRRPDDRNRVGVSAEKGYLRETGNLLFHLSLVLLLIGIALGAFRGFKGTVLVNEGAGFSNATGSFDDITPGRRFSQDSLVPLTVGLQKFNATYQPDGKALTFDAEVNWQGASDASHAYDIRVNHPLHVGGAKVYLIGHGYAPKLTYTDPAGNVTHLTVPCLPQDSKFLSNCTIKLGDAAPLQLGFTGVFTPTTYLNEFGQVASLSPALSSNAALVINGYSGDLGYNAGTPQSVYTLDTTAMTAMNEGKPKVLRTGDSWTLTGSQPTLDASGKAVYKPVAAGTLRYDGTAQWATFQLTQDPGKGLALVAAIGMVTGLLLSLFVRRRRVWVRAGGVDGTGRTLVEVGGLSRTNPEAFAREFHALSARLREMVPEET